MTSNEILHADVLDILFDNRNKQYGAYSLRRHYNERLSAALAMALSGIFLLFLLIRPSDSVIIENDSPPDVVTRVVVLPRQEIKAPAAPHDSRPQKPVAQKSFASIKMVEEVRRPLATVSELETSVISNMNVDGPSLTNAVIPQPQTNITIGVVQKAENTKTSEIMERAPQFPGGQEAWLKFLNKNLRSPSDLEAGDKRTVMIRFEVDADGSITNFQVIRTAGNVFDNEVIRVLKKMPRWTPAIQNGRPAAVSFTQPVTFVGVEENE